MANIASIIEEMLEMMDTIITISANYLTYLLIYSTSYIQFELFFPLTKLILNQYLIVVTVYRIQIFSS